MGLNVRAQQNMNLLQQQGDQRTKKNNREDLFLSNLENGNESKFSNAIKVWADP